MFNILEDSTSIGGESIPIMKLVKREKEEERRSNEEKGHDVSSGGSTISTPKRQYSKGNATSMTELEIINIFLLVNLVYILIEFYYNWLVG